jgi:biopolymer transport protein ExbD
MKFYAKQRRMPQVMIVSLIDIFAILLIFVIVTTTFKQPEKAQPAVTIKLPESKTAATGEKGLEPLVLTISKDEEIFLDDKKVSLEELKPALISMMRDRPKHQLALNADTQAPFGTVIKVIDVLKEAGVKGNLAAFMDLKK